MGYEKKRKAKGWKRSVRAHEFLLAFRTYSSNIYSALFKDTDYTGYLKLLHREDGSWIAMMGVWTNEGLPVVCFGNGNTAIDALESLSRGMASNAWKADKYAKPAPFLSIP